MSVKRDKVVIKEETVSSDDLASSSSGESGESDGEKPEVKTEDDNDVIVEEPDDDDVIVDTPGPSTSNSQGHVEESSEELRLFGQKKSGKKKKLKREVKEEVSEGVEERKDEEGAEDLGEKKKKAKKLSSGQEERTEANRDNMARVKPNWAMDREKERSLIRIATRGVVQLFNAVRDEQNTAERKLNAAGSSDRKRAKAVRSMTKQEFMNKLKKFSAQTTQTNNSENSAVKIEDKEETEISGDRKWSVFEDHFLTKNTSKEKSEDQHEESLSAPPKKRKRLMKRRKKKNEEENQMEHQ